MTRVPSPWICLPSMDIPITSMDRKIHGSLATYTSSDDKYGVSPSLIGRFLQLPYIRAIFAFFVGSEEENEDANKALLTLPKGSSAIAHLELKESRLSTPDITNMLMAPIALTTFIYETGTGYLSWCDISFTALRDALTLQEHSLENIWLDYEHQYEVCFTDESDFAPMRSFASFTKLKSLRIATVFIFGGEKTGYIDQQYRNEMLHRRLTDVFPATLEVLHFSHCQDHFSHLSVALEELPSHASMHVPKLNKIILEGSGNELKRPWSDSAGLAKLAEIQDISLTTLDTRVNTSPEDSVERGWGTDASIQWATEVRGSF